MADRGEALTAELVGESALTLGRAGARLQAALDELAAYDAAGVADVEPRRLLIDTAGEQAWYFVVLRAAMGWYDEQQALDAYRVPMEVRLRMGVRRRADVAPTPAPLVDRRGPPYR